MYVLDIASLLGLAALLWYWLDAIRCKEIARAAGRHASQQAEVQFLDDTVELTKLRLRRDAQGRLAWYREYRFEFTRDSASRNRGALALLGQRVVRLKLDP
jgi:hypothetical protein